MKPALTDLKSATDSFFGPSTISPSMTTKPGFIELIYLTVRLKVITSCLLPPYPS